MNEQSTITCPNCSTEIDVNNLLYNKLRVELENKFNSERQKENEQIRKRSDELKAEKEAFEQKKKKENELFTERLEAKLKESLAEKEILIKSKIEKENSEQFELLQKELSDKSAQVIELNKMKAEVEKLKREHEENKSKQEAEAQSKLFAALSQEREKTKKEEKERTDMIINELQKKYDDQKKLTDEMKRKQEQGSMQLQGEVQELAIEDWLRNNFPFDKIEEVKKGARGADCIQIVNSRVKENCGSIYYESKRTKDFSKNWIEKFKNDIREKGATVGVFVTDAMPPDMDRMGLKDGIWICSFEEFKGLCFVIREHICELDLALSSQENKGDKMHMLYDYLTSNEFKLQVEGILDGYIQMQKDLDSEKRSITGLWKKREKQLQKVLSNTNFMYNSLKGIAGSAIQPIQFLELPEGIDEESEERDEED